MKTLTIQTAQISHNVAWDDPRNIDATAKSAKGVGVVLAPSWQIVGGLKRTLNPDEPKWAAYQPITWPEYVEQYLQLLRGRYVANPTPFMALIDMGEVCLHCYCGPDDLCHRHLASRVLHGIAKSKGYSVTIVPEDFEGRGSDD